MKNLILKTGNITLIVLLIFILFACSGSGDGEGDVDVSGKQSQFVSSGEGDNGRYAGESDAAAPTAGAEFANEDEKAQDGDIFREIEEADIIKIEDERLYILNQYSGFIICDISTPDQPKKLGSTVISGSPVDMYVRGNQAYVLVTQQPEPIYYLADYRGGSSMDSGETSRVDVVDISSESNPKIINSFTIEGAVADSRIVGDVLYVVSATQAYYPYLLEGDVMEDGAVSTEANEIVQQQSSEPNTFVASIDISDSSNIKEVDREELGGSAQYIHVTQEIIFVQSPPGYYYDDKTTISYLDISDPSGEITERGTIEVDGRIEDKFKMDYDDGYFRVCTHTWKDEGMSYLFVIDVSNPDEMEIVGNVELGKGEQLFATRFDGSKAYMVTFERIDPLWVIDLSDPINPEITGELEVPGWSTHIEPKGDRLIALGVDDSNGWLVSVSLFDVSDPASPSLLDRISFGESSGWSSSTAYDDVKALTIIDEMGLILLPYSSSGYDDGYYKNQNHLQLIDFTEDSLKARGRVTQKGSVLRSRSFSDRLFSVSADELQVIDASDRDDPEVTARLALAVNIVDFAALENDYGIQVVSSNYSNYFLRSVPLSDSDSLEAVDEIELNESGYRKIFVNGNLLYVLTENYNYDYEAKPLDDENETASVAVIDDIAPYYYSSTMVTVYDCSDPDDLEKRGSIVVPGNYYNFISARMDNIAIYPYSSGGDIIQVKDDVLVFSHLDYYYYPYIDYGEFEGSDEGIDSEMVDAVAQNQSSQFNGLIALDMSDPDNPQEVSRLAIDIHNASGFFANDDTIYFSYSEPIENDSEDKPQSKFYLGRVDISDISDMNELSPINIPGTCIGVNNDASVAYTIDSQWSDYYSEYSESYSFNAVSLKNDTAYLLDSLEMESYYYNVIIDGDLAYLSSGGYYYWGGKNELVLIDLADPEELESYDSNIEGYGAGIIGAKDRKVFINMSNMVSCYDVSDLDEPQQTDFRNGWGNGVFFTNDMAYLPLGYYGLWAKEL